MESFIREFFLLSTLQNKAERTLHMYLRKYIPIWKVSEESLSMESSLKMTCLVTSLEKYIFNLFLFPNVMCLCFYVVEIEAYMSSLIELFFKVYPSI